MPNNIIVVGDGPVALAFAIAAQLAGRSVRLIHCAMTNSGNRHYALGRRRLHFLRRLGVSPAHQPVARFHLYAGKICLPISSGDGEALCHIVMEKALLSALTARIAQLDIPTIIGQRIDWQETTASTIQVKVDDTILSAALLVIADGARSAMAGQLGVFSHSFDFHQQAFVATVKAPSLSPQVARQWFADNDVVALLPIGDSYFSLIWSTHRVLSLEASVLTDQLRHRIQVEDSRVLADQCIRAFPLRAVRRATRTATRTVFLGDATHTIHPLAGQGLNMGLMDADSLLSCLRYSQDIGAAAGLTAYAVGRAWHARTLHTLTTFLLKSERRTSVTLAAGYFPGIRQLAVAFANI